MEIIGARTLVSEWRPTPRQNYKFTYSEPPGPRAGLLNRAPGVVNLVPASRSRKKMYDETKPKRRAKNSPKIYGDRKRTVIIYY